MLKKIRNWFSKQIPLSARLHIGRVLIVLLPILIIAQPVSANSLLIAGGVLLFLPVIIGILLEIVGLLTSFIVYLIDALILPGQNSLLFDNPVIQDVWSMMQGAANVLFFLAILAMSIMIITRSAGYNFKKAVTSLITAVVLANFSFVIVRVLIEAGDALRNSASTVFNAGGATMQGMNELALTFVSTDLMSSFKNFDFTTNPMSFTINGIFMLIVGLIGLYVFFRLAFILIERAVQLVIKAIFAPIIFALSVLPHPELQKMASNWWSDVVRWVLVLPLVFLLIGIAHSLAQFQSASIYELINDFTTNGAGTIATNTGEFIFGIVIIAILISASNVHQMLNVPISAATKFFTDTVGNAVPNLIGASIKRGGVQLGRGIKQKVATTGAGRWWERKFTTPSKRFDSSLKAGEEVRDMRIDDSAGGIAAKDWYKISPKYNDAFQAYYESKGYDKDRDIKKDPSLENRLKKEFRNVNPGLADDFERVKKEHINHRVKHVKRLNDYNEGPTASMKEILKGMAALRNAPDVADMDQTARDDLDGRFGGFNHKADNTGPNGDRWKRKINDGIDQFDADNGAGAWEATVKKGQFAWPHKGEKYEREEFHNRNNYDDPAGAATEDGTGSASRTDIDTHTLETMATKQNQDEAHETEVESTLKLENSGSGGVQFAQDVEALIQQNGGSAAVNIIQQAATSDGIDNLGTLLDTISNIQNMDGIRAIQSSDGSTQDKQGKLNEELRSAMGSDISPEDRAKAAELLSDSNANPIAMQKVVSAMKQSQQDGQESYVSRTQHIQNVQVSNKAEIEYQEVEKNSPSKTESTAANEERIKEAGAKTDSYSIKEIQDDIEKATQQLSQMILKSSDNKDEQLKTYQRQTLGQINFANQAQFKELTTKIFGKLKHQFNGSIIEDESQIDQMTPREVYQLLDDTKASANKLNK